MKNVTADHERVLPELPPRFDRRQRERIAIAIPIRIVSCGLLTERSDAATCTDLSEGGLSFDCDAELNVGEIVVVEFRQHGEPTYQCDARLMYRLGRRYGAYFLSSE